MLYLIIGIIHFIIITFHCTFTYIQATKGFWTPERDKKLMDLVKMYGSNLSWPQLAKAFPGVRGKFIRQRYRNHLDPQLKTHAWTWDEDQILKKCYLKYGNRWEIISKYLPGRSANQVKNRTKRKQFRELFPQPPSKKKAWDPTVYPTKTTYLNPAKRLTIAEEARIMAVKQEENHKKMKEEILKEREKELIEEPPLPKSLEIIAENEKKRKKMTKGKKFQLTTHHLQKTYELIKANLTKKQPSDFYLIFETRTKKEIFLKIKSIQWTITQLWPLVTNHKNRFTHDQQIVFFLYCLIRADNKLANKILHRLLKCQDEQYLMKKIQLIIQDIDEFIRLELQIAKQKEMHEAHNQSDPKGETLESGNTYDTPPKEESAYPQPKIRKESKQIEKCVKMEEQQPNTDKDHLDSNNCEQPPINQNDQIQAFSKDNDFDLAIMGSQFIIGNELTEITPNKPVKIQTTSAKEFQTKIQTQTNQQKDSNQGNSQQESKAVMIENVNLVEESREIQSSADPSYLEISSVSEEIPHPQPQCINFKRINFIIRLQDEEGEDAEQSYSMEYSSLADDQQAQFTEMSASNYDFYNYNCSEQSSHSKDDSNEVLMRVKRENIEEEQPIKQNQQLKQCLSSIFRTKILNKVQEKQAKTVITIS